MTKHQETPVISAQAEIQQVFEGEAINNYRWIPVVTGMTVIPETPVISAQAEIQQMFEGEALNKYRWIPVVTGMTVTPGNTRHLHAGGDPADV